MKEEPKQGAAPNAAEIATAAYEVIYEGASQIIGDGQEHGPIFLLEMKEGKRSLIPIPVGSASKNMVALLHKEFALQPPVQSASLVMEAWACKGDPTDPRFRSVMGAIDRGELHVEDLPERQEVLVILIRVGAKVFSARCNIDREAKTLERAVLEDLSALPAGSSTSGRFIDGDARGFTTRESEARKLS